MTLKDCTKAELLWIIDRLRNRGLYRLDTIISIALNDLEYQREQKKLDEADRLNEESARLRQQAAELLTPYEGKSILDVRQMCLTMRLPSLRKRRRWIRNGTGS